MHGEIKNKLEFRLTCPLTCSKCVHVSCVSVVVVESVVVAADHSENNYITGCLLMVFVAVALPRLARNDMSFFKASLEGNTTANLASVE